MGKMKELAIDMMNGDVDIVPPPTVYLMMCEGKPVGVYVDKHVAEYEMHLCIQGDEHELGMKNHYEIKPMTLITNAFDKYDIGQP